MTGERISAAEAAARLGVKRETIYAYVSRGLIHSQRHIDGKSSTFDPAEIDRFRRRKAGGRPGRLEVPVASSITEVVDGSIRYRGEPLGDLAAAFVAGKKTVLSRSDRLAQFKTKICAPASKTLVKNLNFR